MEGRRLQSTKLGYVGPPLPRDNDVYRVVAVGGSTTECGNLDDFETWPRLLMEAINVQQQRVSVWVANAGQSGRNTVDHLTLFQTLPILSKVDMLIFLIGINDLIASLAFEGGPTQEHLERNSTLFRAKILTGGKKTRPFFRQLQLF